MLARRILTYAGVRFLILMTAFSGAGAEGSGAVATPGHPAVVVAAGSVQAGETTARLIVRVTAFSPPRDAGPVACVVAIKGVGRPLEIGRFAVFPAEPFSASEPEKAKSFALPLPSAVIRKPLRVVVSLEAVRGTGAGSSVEIGAAQIH